MKKDPFIFIEHILDSISLIEKYTQGKTESQFLDSVELQDAVVRRLEIIGEAVKNTPEDFRKKHPHIEWKKIAGLRDVLAHEYFGIDYQLTWQIIVRDLPLLKKSLLEIKK